MNQYLCTTNTLIIHVLPLAPSSRILSQCTIRKSRAFIGGVLCFMFCLIASLFCTGDTPVRKKAE